MEWWQQYSSYLINLAVVITGIMVWRAYKRVQGNAAEWKSFAQRHALVHTDNSALGTVSGTVDGMKFELSQEMERNFKSLSIDQDRRYEHDNNSIESMRFEIKGAPAALKLRLSSDPTVAMHEKFAQMKGESIEWVKTGDEAFDRQFAIMVDPPARQEALDWLNSKRRSALLSGPKDVSFALAHGQLCVSTHRSLGNLAALEKLFTQLRDLALALR